MPCLKVDSSWLYSSQRAAFAQEGMHAHRLLAYIGHVVALALASGAESWTGEEVAQASRTVLLALEVGDRLLALLARRGAEMRPDKFDLSALGISLPTPGNGMLLTYCGSPRMAGGGGKLNPPSAPST